MTAPSKIGRYEIVRRLGKGMTDVYLAIDTVENRKVALKVVAVGGNAANRMVLEAERRGAAIQRELRTADPRMIEVYDFGEQDGCFFVAMQYVEGRNLAEVLCAERTVEPLRAAAIALELCEQLAKFHSWQAAVVHGDIKPSNIHLGPNDTVRLLDFGIAKNLRANGDATAHQFGSPGYCAPERLERSEVDQQSDLWAVGATLYEMLAGVPPYQAENTRKLEGLIRSKRPPRALPPGVPRPLRFIVSKALAPVAPGRYASANEMQADLQAFLEHRPTAAELERAWGAGATIEAAREALRKATRTVVRARAHLRVAGAVGWFAAGMGLWLAGSYGWRALEPRAASMRLTHAAAPSRPATWNAATSHTMASAPDPNRELAALYRAAGERAMQSDAADWHKAEILLQRSLDLGDADPRAAGELALARGYATLERLGGGQYAPSAAARLRAYARAQLEAAAAEIPDDSRAWMGLASRQLIPPDPKPAARRKPAAHGRKKWR